MGAGIHAKAEQQLPVGYSRGGDVAVKRSLGRYEGG
jgi:hypothetical protein